MDLVCEVEEVKLHQLVIIIAKYFVKLAATSVTV
jgi:hypothetical protein